MERKAIQIVAYPDHLYALCDDGAIFQQSQGAWFELEPIPHTEKTGLTELPPELLLAAQLKVAEERFDGDGIRRLYESVEYPLARRAADR